jgi:thymidylate synthase
MLSNDEQQEICEQINAETEHSDIFRGIYEDLLTYGIETSPRGQKVIELENYEYVVPPYVRFTNFEDRKFNINYVKDEFLWYLHGDRFDTSITEHATMWKSLVNGDGSINSNYGQYLFGEGKQFDNTADVLKSDKDSRRAAMMILSREHLLSKTNDYPCTYSISFRIRSNKLNMTVRMRSQDSIFGMSNDIPAFSLIHEMMYVTMRETYPDLEHGDYTHSADSFHVYERHFEMINKLVKYDSKFSLIECPKISSISEVSFLRAGNFDSIPVEYEFSRWITTKE